MCVVVVSYIKNTHSLTHARRTWHIALGPTDIARKFFCSFVLNSFVSPTVYGASPASRLITRYKREGRKNKADFDTGVIVARRRRRSRQKNQVATLVSHCAVNAAGWRRLRSTPRPSPSRLLVAAQVPHYVVQCPVLWIMLIRVRGSPVPVSRPRRPSDDLWSYGAARCCCGVGDGAFCTRSRRAGVDRGTSEREIFRSQQEMWHTQ